MRDEKGKSIPFCAKEFDLEVLNGKEDLSKYVHMAISDRGEDVGKLKVKM